MKEDIKGTLEQIIKLVELLPFGYLEFVWEWANDAQSSKEFWIGQLQVAEREYDDIGECIDEAHEYGPDNVRHFRRRREHLLECINEAKRELDLWEDWSAFLYDLANKEAKVESFVHTMQLPANAAIVREFKEIAEREVIDFSHEESRLILAECSGSMQILRNAIA